MSEVMKHHYSDAFAGHPLLVRTNWHPIGNHGTFYQRYDGTTVVFYLKKSTTKKSKSEHFSMFRTQIDLKTLIKLVSSPVFGVHLVPASLWTLQVVLQLDRSTSVPRRMLPSTFDMHQI